MNKPGSVRHAGFTLLEVLVALAVAATGLAAVIKVAGGNAYNIQYLQDKTFAQWVAMNKVAEIRLSKAPPSVGKSNGKYLMVGKEWFWQIETKKSDFPDASIIEVSVFPGNDDDQDALVMLTMLKGSK